MSSLEEFFRSSDERSEVDSGDSGERQDGATSAASQPFSGATSECSDGQHLLDDEVSSTTASRDGFASDWRYCIVPIVKDGVVVAAQPLPPPPHYLAACQASAPVTSMLLVDSLVANTGPLLQLAHAIEVRGRQLVVAAMTWQHAEAFKSSGASGRLVLCVQSFSEALATYRPSLIVYTFATRTAAMWHEQHYGVPAIMLGFKRAYVSTDHPPRPSIKIRDPSDADVAADVLDEFICSYVESGIFKHLQDLPRA